MVSSKQQAKDRQIRVFISSTFRDMQAERDVLVKKVFPELRKLCEERAVAWAEVDLRWGITEQESSEGQVLPLCLAEIERCRPYFIGLLGDRYGWVPEPETLSKELLETHPWLKEHPQKSVTELEIIYGVLQSPKMRDRSLFYFRDPEYLNKLPVKAVPTDFQSESSTSAKNLKNLKDNIRAEYDAGKLGFKPYENYHDPEALGELVLDDFKALIEKDYPKSKTPDPIDQEATLHDAYGQSRRLGFVGRENLLVRMDKHAATSGAKPLVVTGESGCGKSALLAEWAARWKENYPDDLVIQHYIGSTSESADWQGLVRRVLSELKRAFDITEEVPIQPEALSTAMQDWLVKTAGTRRIVLVFDALNQLSTTDAAARQLGWLPFAFPLNVILMVSSIAGESLEALRQRGWLELPVPLFGTEDITPAALAYFKIFSKKPSDKLLAKLNQTAPTTRNPLYLRAVLDELRQFGEHEKVEARAAHYLESTDLPELFDQILTRWEQDFGDELVRHSLSLIACARFGLSETELRDLQGKNNENGEFEPLPGRHWTPLYLAAENALAQRSGLLTFGHDYLRKAVETRYFKAQDDWEKVRLELADWFEAIAEPTDRKLDELPSLLCDTKSFYRLAKFLVIPDTFLQMREHERRRWELHKYWLVLEPIYDPVSVYWNLFESLEPYYSRIYFSYIGTSFGDYLIDAGHFAGAELFYRRSLLIYEQELGADHPQTLNCKCSLAGLLYDKGDYEEAEQLYRQLLPTQEKVFGSSNVNTLRSVLGLALLIDEKGDHEGAEQLRRRVFEGTEHVLAEEHLNAIHSLGIQSFLEGEKEDSAGEEMLVRQQMEVSSQVLGPDHPVTLGIVNNLALLLSEKGDYEGAELLFQRSVETRQSVLGSDHPDTLTSVNNLAELLHSKGDSAGAEPLYRRALAGRERVLGKDHPDTLISVNNLALLLKMMGDNA